MTMRKFLFPRIHGPDHDLCIRSILVVLLSVVNDGLCFLNQAVVNAMNRKWPHMLYNVIISDLC